LYSFDDTLAQEIEQHAVRLARGAGEILAEHFGQPIEVEFKDKKERDPVTRADKATQEYLVAEITKRFPDHGILGEEATDEEKESEAPAKDILWVLDPLDGTTNFMNGLPVFASSIGVLYRGRPVAAALYVPWPQDGGGFVLHCRKGGGCFADDDPVSVFETQEPVPNRLIGLPGYFGVVNRFSKKTSQQGRRTPHHRKYRLRVGHDRQRGDAVRDLRHAAAVGYGRRGAGGGRGRGDGDDPFPRREELASHGLVGPVLGTKDTDHEGTPRLGRAANSGQQATGAPGGQQRAPPLQTQG
jgi:fructose-1,6-bisphosphatase/inositol monophosphatase family enzyme